MYLINTLLSELYGLGVNNSNLFVIGAVTRWVNPMVSRNYVPHLRGSRKFTGSNTRMYLINTLLSELYGLGVNNSNLFVIGAVTRWVYPMVSSNYVPHLRGSRKLRWVGGPDIFLVISIFHRGPYRPTSRSNWTLWVQLLLERGPYQYFYGNKKQIVIIQVG